MTAWALWDRLIPVALFLAVGVLSFLLGRGWERVDWLTGKRGCGHDPDCSDVEPKPCPQCDHAVRHTAQNGCEECACDALVDWLGPVALKRRAR